MKTSLIIWASSFVVGLFVSLAFANPDMLPKHPGYPMGKSVDPVKGQPLANDPGRRTSQARTHWLSRRNLTMSILPSISQSIRTTNGCSKKREREFFQRFRGRASRSNRL
jgi:hypothetical protein